MSTFSWLVSLVLATSSSLIVTFDSTTPGRTPAGWTTLSSERGAPARWEILRDASAPSPPNVFAPVSRGPDTSRFPIAVLNAPPIRDGEISVRFKPVAGKEDRSAGLVWRYWDPNNYYLVRASATENDLTLYKMHNGKLTPLAAGSKPHVYAVKHNIPSNSWGILKVVYRGPVFSVYLNHRRLLQVRDTSYMGPGKVGLWTDGDSVTYFDNFQVKAR